MRPIFQPKHLAVIICLFLTRGILAQDAKLYPPERSLLELIANDTISHTVSYLPEPYQFSIADKGDKHFILLKSGKHNYFLLDGTNRVYIPDPDQPTARLVRIDSSMFIGDNFNMMAFIRKDTLYQYGGYGFWNNRDFFSFYRPTIHGWEFLTGGDALQNLYTFNYFEEKADKFFTIGRYSQNTHKSFNPDFHDSIYSYDLKTRKWSTLGKITNTDILKKINSRSGLTFSSPFGFGVFHLNRFQLIDFLNNKIYSLRTSVADSVELDINNKDSKFQNLVFLRDTLFIINGDEASVTVRKFRLSKIDLALSTSVALYEPNSSSPSTVFQFSVSSAQLIFISLTMLALISVLSIYLIRKVRPN